MTDNKKLEQNYLFSMKPDEVIKELEDTGNLYHLANLYLDGSLIPKNTEKAVEVIYRAIDKGCSYSKILLAYLYQEGVHFEKDLEKSFQMFSHLVDSKVFKANSYLAPYYENGIVAKQDHKKAFRLYFFHYLIPDLSCIRGLERLYRNGNGVEKSVEIADFYLEKSKILDKYTRISTDFIYRGIPYDSEEQTELLNLFHSGFEEFERFKDHC